MADNQVRKDNDKTASRPGKRKRPFGESLRAAYEAVSFSPIGSSGHPRSPHRFFKESYVASFAKEESNIGSQSPPRASVELKQVVHHHVNGLCIITAGSNLPDKSMISALEFKAKEASTCSAAEKRKRQAKMLRGGKVDEAVLPNTVIAELRQTSGETIPIFACVWGTILELNHSITVDVLLDDPLLDGYVAVILPSGSFPPRDRNAVSGQEEGADGPSPGKVPKLNETGEQYTN